MYRFVLLAFFCLWVSTSITAQSKCCENYYRDGNAALKNNRFDEAIALFTEGGQCFGVKCHYNFAELVKQAKAKKQAESNRRQEDARREAQRKREETAQRQRDYEANQKRLQEEEDARQQEAARKRREKEENERRQKEKDENERKYDLQAWNIAKSADNINAYQSYINTCSKCAYKTEAQNRINQLKTPTKVEGEPETVFVKGGTFQMGQSDPNIGGNGYSKDEQPVHSVTVSDFYMGKYEVTVGEYLKFCTATNSHWPEWLENGNQYHVEKGTNSYYKNLGYSRSGSNSLPIVGVSWHDAVAYCEWLSSTTGKTYRLPTEAEWEYAAKANSSYKYAGSNDLDAVAWHGGNSGSKPHPVGQKQANGLGLYDMSGNVWEWCSDWYKGYPGSSGVSDYTGSYRVNRGGSWNDNAVYCRPANRSNNTPANRGNGLGFRVCLTHQ